MMSPNSSFLSGNYTRRQFLSLSAAGLLGASWAGCANDASAPARRRPNILFVFTDQMRGQAMGCMGHPDVKTPHLDQLAAEGVLLRNTLANTPVCCPARANMLTGTYAHRNGMVANDLRLRESETTIAELLRQQGYRTGFVGKWHLDGGKRQPGFVPPGPRRQGFDFWAANQCSHRHFDTHYFRDSNKAIPIERFEAEAWTDLGISFMEQHQEEPFFLTLAMGPPHNPYGAPERYMQMYESSALTMRPNWQKGVSRAGRKEIAAYYAAITAVDEQIGRLMTTLDKLGIADDTIVLFTSDHGDMLGSQGQRLKRKPWEESVRVPGILRYPAAEGKKGRAEEQLFTHVDIAPTLLGLCGMNVPDWMQGSNLSGVVTGETTEQPQSAFFQIFGPYNSGGVKGGWRGVRTERYMYARREDEPWVLYDLRKDPYQMENLANDSGAAAARRQMEKRLKTWMQKTGDSWAHNWHHPVEDKGRLYRHKTFYTVEGYRKWAAKHPEITY